MKAMMSQRTAPRSTGKAHSCTSKPRSLHARHHNMPNWLLGTSGTPCSAQRCLCHVRAIALFTFITVLSDAGESLSAVVQRSAASVRWAVFISKGGHFAAAIFDHGQGTRPPQPIALVLFL